MSKSIDPKALVLMRNFPPDAWQTVLIRENGQEEPGDLLLLNEAVEEFVTLWAEANEYERVYIEPVWNMSWHEADVDKLMQEKGE